MVLSELSVRMLTWVSNDELHLGNYSQICHSGAYDGLAVYNEAFDRPKGLVRRIERDNLRQIDNRKVRIGRQSAMMRQ